MCDVCDSTRPSSKYGGQFFFNSIFFLPPYEWREKKIYLSKNPNWKLNLFFQTGCKTCHKTILSNHKLNSISLLMVWCYLINNNITAVQSSHRSFLENYLQGWREKKYYKVSKSHTKSLGWYKSNLKKIYISIRPVNRLSEN